MSSLQKTVQLDPRGSFPMPDKGVTIMLKSENGRHNIGSTTFKAPLKLDIQTLVYNARLKNNIGPQIFATTNADALLNLFTIVDWQPRKRVLTVRCLNCS